MARLRVLHILPSMRGYGAERQVMQLLEGIRAVEIVPALLTIYAPDAEADAPFPILSADRHGRRDYGFLPRLVREIRRISPHIVHTHTHVGRYWGRAAAALAGVPRLVHTEHNPCDARRKPFERLADAILHRRTDRIVTFFPEQATYLSKHDGVPRWKIAVIANGLPMPVPRGDRQAARSVVGAGDQHFVIFNVGRMEFQKNQELSLSALAAIRPELRSRLLLCFAGAGERESEMRARCHDLDLDANVRFLGYRNDVRELLAAADLLLMTSWFEGMPLTIMEAMLAGVPVITTPWTGSRTMLGDGQFGFITRGYDAASVAATIERVVERTSVRENVAANAQRHAEHAFDISRMIAAHVELYRELGGLTS